MRESRPAAVAAPELPFRPPPPPKAEFCLQPLRIPCVGPNPLAERRHDFSRSDKSWRIVAPEKNGKWEPPEQRRTEGRHGRGGRLRIAAPANYRAASRLAGSTTTRAASRGRCAASQHERPVTCTGRAAKWARRARGRGRLCRPAPTSLAAVLCPLACITRRQPPQVPLQL